MSEYFDLGDYHRRVTTGSAEAQRWFDRGLVWSYAFNHEEARRCFEQTIAADPGCAMAHWGVAYVVGPNYNKAWAAYDPTDLAESLRVATQARQAALALCGQAGPVERAIIETLPARYPSADTAGAGQAWCESYAQAMRGVYRDHPDDLDVIALFAEALLNVTPWAMWDLVSGQPAVGAHTVEAVEVLEGALERPEARLHAGILHMYLHLMEMSPYPERALWAADWLRDLVPDGGHLQHMPTHIDLLCGDYRRVVTSNAAATAADRRYVERRGSLNFYTLYRAHNYHFQMYGAMFLGHRQLALSAADQLIAALPEELLRTEVPPMADWLEGFLAMKVHVLIRFGMWDQIIDAGLPDDPQLYCVTTAMTHYAKGVALAASGRIAESERHRRLFTESVERVPESRTVFNNTCRDILAIAAAMLDGELEYRKGNYDTAFASLRRSIELDDSLPYDEPWGWMQPTRHAYGALLLEQGQVELAEAVYRADLGLDDSLPRASRHPNNVWSLHGHHECLTRLGKHELAGLVRQQLELATAQADSNVTASCACRRS